MTNNTPLAEHPEIMRLISIADSSTHSYKCDVNHDGYTEDKCNCGYNEDQIVGQVAKALLRAIEGLEVIKRKNIIIDVPDPDGQLQRLAYATCASFEDEINALLADIRRILDGEV